MKPIDRLTKSYILTKTFTANSRLRKQRISEYVGMRNLCLDCDLVSFADIERMEYEVEQEHGK